MGSPIAYQGTWVPNFRTMARTVINFGGNWILNNLSTAKVGSRLFKVRSPMTHACSGISKNIRGAFRENRPSMRSFDNELNGTLYSTKSATICPKSGSTIDDICGDYLNMIAPSTPTTLAFQMREITILDAPFIQALTQTPGWLEHIGDRGTATTEGAFSYIQRAYTDAYAAHGYGLWAIVHRANQVPLGVCGLVCRPDAPAPDLGFALLPAFEGQGWVRRASEVVLAHAHTALKLSRVDAYANEGNARSRRTLEYLGFRLNTCAHNPSFGAVVCQYQKNLH